MKLLFKCFFLLVFTSSYANTAKSETEVNILLKELIEETDYIKNTYYLKNKPLYKKLYHLTEQLANIKGVEEQVRLLIEKDKLKEKILLNKNLEASDINKIRYIKGLDIIKILYEKTLSLDHHFTTVTTFSEINKISNPNYYPEFIKLKDEFKNKRYKKKGFNLTGILGNNIYTSVLHSLVSLFTNENISSSEKESNLKEVECILDFTLLMHNDLNTIFFETAFLQKSNENVIKELNHLFEDYTKPIKYYTNLKTCRANDDWNNIINNLELYINQLVKITADKNKQYKAHQMQIDLAFSIDRLLQFIALYNSLIDQCSKFYEKFAIMLDSYENREECSAKISKEYIKLKLNVSVAIEKFNTAYKPIEVNGSKLKEVLYGAVQYN